MTTKLNTPLFIVLPLFTLLARLGETGNTYYVIPDDVPPDCPGYPCQPLNNYMENPDDYFNRDRVNVTMYFVHGIHTTKYKDIVIRDLQTFEMVGQDHTDVTVCISVVFNGVSKVSIESLTLSPGIGCAVPRIALAQASTIVIIMSVRGVQAERESVYVDTFQNTTIDDIVCTIVPLSGSIGVSGKSCCVIIAAYSNITVTNVTTFANRLYTPITTYASEVTLAGNISFVNNTGTKGGAVALYASNLNIDRNTSVYFHRNTAREVGGAIYVATTGNPYQTECFYQLLNYANSSKTYSLHFGSNTAGRGGDHIYGANMQSICSVAYYKDSPSGYVGKTIRSYQAMNYFFKFDTKPLSGISSDPRGICLCDESGRPQCADSITDIYRDCWVSPGQTFALSVAIIGGSFGTTTGTVYADFLQMNNNMSSTNIFAPSLANKYQYAQWITNHRVCFELQYTVYSGYIDEPIILYLTSSSESQHTVRERLDRRESLTEDIAAYHTTGVISDALLTTPIFLNITLLPCPRGFSLKGDPPTCNCYVHSQLEHYDINCSVVGTISWNGSPWIGADDNDGTLNVNYDCPPNYCKQGHKEVNFENNTDSQCAFNHAGRLCGGCASGYSVAIGSSHCIRCPNNNNLALLIFFVAAGPLLVFFISALNLTVTQGMINGLIFYANIVWAYQDVLFHDQMRRNAFVVFETTFIAWLNLDFGIETCFFNGLNAFWKTWLQYVFPLYTASLFIIGLRYSSNLSKLFGGRSVPTLATLLFLSYTKLLRTIITSLQLAHLTNYPSNTSQYVWSVDGRLNFGHFPHITLLLAAIACLLLLWLPYTMLLFLMQWLRRTSHSRLSKWITKYKPVTDAYFAPLKDKHQYWFGVLLLARGVLLLISSLTANINPAVSLLLLLGVATLLLCYMNYMQVYKKSSVLILESAFLVNLVLLVGGTMYYRLEEGNQQEILIYVSIGIAFLKFCGIALWSFVRMILKKYRKHRINQVDSYTDYPSIESEGTNTISHKDETLADSSRFRDSILEDAPLVIFKSKHPTY